MNSEEIYCYKCGSRLIHTSYLTGKYDEKTGMPFSIHVYTCPNYQENKSLFGKVSGNGHDQTKRYENQRDDHWEY